MDLLLNPADDRNRLAKIDLRMAWRMGQWHKHLFEAHFVAADIQLYRCVAALVPMFIAQPFVNPHRAVALLHW